MTYKQPTIKSYERGEVGLQFTDSHGEVHEIDNSERQENEVWTRVMGYYRPISAFNVGKRQEARERPMYDRVYPEGVKHK